MVSQVNTSNELYNLRWNSYFSNLINVFTDHQNQEALVDVTLSCEGQFIKAHKLILSACSIYFQKTFEVHTNPQLVILLNDVKFKDLQLIVQFMYTGEVKVADANMQEFLALGKMLQVKGLCSVELQEKQKAQTNGETKNNDNKSTPSPTKITENKKVTCNKVVQSDVRNDINDTPLSRKRKTPSPAPTETKKKSVNVPNPEISPNQDHDTARIPRPPNAFMIFANQWRKKLAVEYPNESNKDISVRLGNMWKSLSPETKDAFYEDARRADEEHKLKYPGPQEARHRKAIANINKGAQKIDPSPKCSTTEEELIEVKCEDSDVQSNQTNGSD